MLCTAWMDNGAETPVDALLPGLVLFAHFDEAMMHMPWEVFVEDYLVRRLRARHVVCGHDFHFGDRGQGNLMILWHLTILIPYS